MVLGFDGCAFEPVLTCCTEVLGAGGHPRHHLSRYAPRLEDHLGWIPQGDPIGLEFILAEKADVAGTQAFDVEVKVDKGDASRAVQCRRRDVDIPLLAP